MNAFWTILGVVVLIVTLFDVFETIVLPRTVRRGLRMAPLLLKALWGAFAPLVRRLGPSEFRQTLLMMAAPLSLAALIVTWGGLLILGFALVHWGIGTPWNQPELVTTFGGFVYASGVNFFTLGLGDVTTSAPVGRFLAVLESGSGFGFMGLVIGYIPVFYGAFSRREVAMVLLDSKAGSNSSATEMLRRYSEAGVMHELAPLLKEYERWAGELLESYLSYPNLAFYRSQHDDQSWLKTLTTILDVCTLVEVGFAEEHPWSRELRFQARATFAMGRHVIVDLAYVIDIAPDRHAPDRLPAERLAALRAELAKAGLQLRSDEVADLRLGEIRGTYEPYVAAIAQRMIVDLPEWKLDRRSVDNWQTSAWDGMRHLD